MNQNESMKIDVKIHAIHTEGTTLANASVTLNDCFAVRGVRIMQGTGGPFVSMPSYKTGEGYRDICFPCTAAFHRQFHDTVINAYQQALAQSSQRQNVPAHNPQPPAPSFEGQTM